MERAGDGRSESACNWIKKKVCAERQSVRAWRRNTTAVTFLEVNSEIHGTHLGPSFLLLLILGFLVFQLIGFKRRREPLLFTELVLSSRLFNLSSNFVLE